MLSCKLDKILLKDSSLWEGSVEWGCTGGNLCRRPFIHIFHCYREGGIRDIIDRIVKAGILIFVVSGGVLKYSTILAEIDNIGGIVVTSPKMVNVGVESKGTKSLRETNL